MVAYTARSCDRGGVSCPAYRRTVRSREYIDMLEPACGGWLSISMDTNGGAECWGGRCSSVLVATVCLRTSPVFPKGHLYGHWVLQRERARGRMETETEMAVEKGQAAADIGLGGCLAKPDRGGAFPSGVRGPKQARAWDGALKKVPRQVRCERGTASVRGVG